MVPAGGDALASGALAVCPRCYYRGQGLSYFMRGSHRAGLVAATIFTLPLAVGAGGFVYYGLRRDHRICPRCGLGWGKHAERALRFTGETAAAARPSIPAAAGESIKRGWSIALFVSGAILLTIGAAEFEAVLAALGVLATAGAVLLHRAANAARETRRAALVSAMQTPVLKLAGERHGRLTVTEVAASLGWPLARAEKILNSLDDGWRVSSDITDEGVIVYQFRELQLGKDRGTLLNSE
jgi:hypothetical protein